MIYVGDDWSSPKTDGVHEAVAKFWFNAHLLTVESRFQYRRTGANITTRLGRTLEHPAPPQRGCLHPARAAVSC